VGLKEDLSQKVTETLKESWDEREGRIIPNVDGLVLKGGAVKLDATFLYADLAQSSLLATDYHHKTAAKIIKVYLICMCKLIKEHDGEVTSFDGDRVMGVFKGKNKNSKAIICALKMNYVVYNIIRPKLKSYFQSLNKKEFIVSHCVGIDTSSVFVVKAGQREANDLVWIGTAPNLAAKLSNERYQNYLTYISNKVFSSMAESLRYADDSKEPPPIDDPLPMLGIPFLHKSIRPPLPKKRLSNSQKLLEALIPKELIWEKTLIKYIGKPLSAYRTKWCYKL